MQILAEKSTLPMKDSSEITTNRHINDVYADKDICKARLAFQSKLRVRIENLVCTCFEPGILT